MRLLLVSMFLPERQSLIEAVGSRPSGSAQTLDGA